MKEINIQPIIDTAKRIVLAHEIPEEPGAYSRYTKPAPDGSRDMGKNEYGCADAINILYTVNDFDMTEDVRTARIRALQSMQYAEDGTFRERTHHTIHTTAHCTGALELLGALPKYPLYALHKYFDKEELYALLDGLAWLEDPWAQSHRGAGVYAALVNSGEITPEFSENYFSWMKENCDPKTGYWKRGAAEHAVIMKDRSRDGLPALFAVMAGGFHYLFNHEYAKMPMPYPESIIDSNITMYREGALPDFFARSAGFIEVDFIYTTSRAMRQTSHRRSECMEMLSELAEDYIAYLLREVTEDSFEFDDLHMLFGTVCALAELQSALPGKIKTDKPLRLVLDKRPFI